MRLRWALPLLGIVLVASPAAAVRLFEDPARIIHLEDRPVDFWLDTLDPGGERLLVLDIERRVHFFPLNGTWPNRPASVIEVDEAPGQYEPFGTVQLIDVDKDGHRDLVVLSDDVFIARGRAEGGYESTLTWRAPGSDTRLSDIDGDGNLDLVSGGTGAWLFRIRRGRGDGRFETATNFADVGPESPGDRLAIADTDGDGDLDMLLQRPDRTIDAWVNQGEGVFARKPVLALPLSSNNIQLFGLARLDANDSPDLVLRHGSGWYNVPDTLVVYPQRDDGTFGPASGSLLEDSAGWSVHFQDMDGDGRDDWVEHHDVLAVRYSGADGSIGPRVELGVTGTSGRLFIRDFDSDGERDLMTMGYESLRMYAGGRLPVDSADEFPPIPYFYSTPPRYQDVDGDGRLDLLGFGYLDSSAVLVLRGREGGGFDPPVRSDVRDDSNPGTSVGSADIDGDGDLDLLRWDRYVGVVSDLFVNAGGARFVQVPTDLRFGRYSGPVVANLDGTGPDEIILIDDEEIGYGLNIYRLTTGGTSTLLHRLEPTHPIYRFGVHDLNDDGRLDIWGLSGGFEVELDRWIQAADGEFVAGPTEYLPAEPYQIWFGDWVGDSRFDLAVTDFEDLLLLTQDATGDWIVHRRIHGIAEVAPIEAPDMNGDGRPDFLAVGDAYDNPRQILLSEPARGLGDPIPIDLPFRPDWLVIGDENQDGHPDLVGADQDYRLFVRHGLPQPGVTLTRWEVETDGWEVTCRWELASPVDESLRVRRESLPAGFQPEIEIGTLPGTVGASRIVDRQVSRAGRYRYRLVLVDAEGFERTVASSDVQVTPPPEPTRLQAVDASPGPGPFVLHYQSSTRVESVLEIFAATGQSVARTPVTLEATRSGVLSWTGRSDGGTPVAAGVYFARLVGTESVARVVIVR